VPGRDSCTATNCIAIRSRRRGRAATPAGAAGPPLPCHYAAGRDGTGAAVDLAWKTSNGGCHAELLENWTNAKFCDVANLILGAILFVSPWIFGFDAGTVSQNAYITGIAIAILAIAALAAFAVWEEWLNLIVGLWALVSPWVLGFQGTTAMTVHVIIGAAVAILAAIELWMMSQIPPRLTTGS
jgi:SPW repeat-containing protein